MTAARRYAEGTKVDVTSSRAEMTALLMKHGCQRHGFMNGPEGDTLTFELHGKAYRFTVQHPMQDAPDQRHWVNQNSYSSVADQAEREWKRRWRAHVLLLKAKLEFVDSGDSSMETEFMPYLLTSGGQTVAEWLADTQGQKLLGPVPR